MPTEANLRTEYARRIRRSSLPNAVSPRHLEASWASTDRFPCLRKFEGSARRLMGFEFRQ